MRDHDLDPMQLRAKHLRMWGLLAHWSEVAPELRQQLCDWQETETRNRSLERRLSASKIGRFKPQTSIGSGRRASTARALKN